MEKVTTIAIELSSFHRGFLGRVFDRALVNTLERRVHFFVRSDCTRAYTVMDDDGGVSVTLAPCFTAKTLVHECAHALACLLWPMTAHTAAQEAHEAVAMYAEACYTAGHEFKTDIALAILRAGDPLHTVNAGASDDEGLDISTI